MQMPIKVTQPDWKLPAIIKSQNGGALPATLIYMMWKLKRPTCPV